MKLSFAAQTAVAVAVATMGLTGCCAGGGEEKLPSTIPIYPGAKRSTADTTLGVSNHTYQTDDPGQKVRDWYAAQADKSWKASCGPDWKKRTEMLGMRFDYRCYSSKTGDDFFRVEIGSNPSKPPTMIRLRHCPKSRVDRCGDQP
jgi:hypothetical protein